MSGGSWPTPWRRMFLHTPWTFRTDERVPWVDVLRRGDMIVFRADLPGMKPEHILVSAQGGMLLIR